MTLNLSHMTTEREGHPKHRAREVDHAWLRKNPEPEQRGFDDNIPYRKNNLFYKTHKFYRILGVEHDADRSFIVRQASTKMHQCARGSVQYNELKQASEVLCDDARREYYNHWGDEQPANMLHVPRSAWQNRRESHYKPPLYPARVDFDPKKFAKELKKLGKVKPEEKVWDLDKLAEHVRDLEGAEHYKNATERRRLRCGDSVAVNPYLV